MATRTKRGPASLRPKARTLIVVGVALLALSGGAVAAIVLLKDDTAPKVVSDAPAAESKTIQVAMDDAAIEEVVLPPGTGLVIVTVKTEAGQALEGIHVSILKTSYVDVTST